MAAGVEVARLRRDNKVLLDDIGDLRGLYNVCLRDRERLQARLDQYGTGKPRNIVTEEQSDSSTERPRDQVTAAHMSHVAK